MPGVIADGQPAQNARKPTKNEQRRARKKKEKQQQLQASSTHAPEDAVAASENGEAKQLDEPQASEPADSGAVDDVIENESLPTDVDDPLLQQFADVFTRFKEQEPPPAAVKEPSKPEVFYSDDDNIQSEGEEERTQKRLSKKARKAAAKLSIAELKALVRKPEIVEWTDVSAQDPKLLVNIKSARNVVPVPSHWSLKREYLSSKRGIEKPAFVLPKFIAETGIMEMRDIALEKQAEASMKQKTRDRVQPGMGKLDIDYHKLYEAFFRRQTKPVMTGYGEVYYEGKEFETNLRHLRPGEISDELREALNMPLGAPPPWLINMQKVGPPPSYPALRIPGLNAPPPPGGQWGFHPGGWGKPPMDDQGKPTFGGDVFGLGGDEDQDRDENAAPGKSEPVDKTLWGELQPFQEEEEEEDEEEEDEDEEDEAENDEAQAAGSGRGGSGNVGTGRRHGIETPYGGTETPGGIASTVPTPFVGAGVSEEFNLRKDRRGNDGEASSHPRTAGTVLGERQIRAEGFFGGERAYDLSGSSGPSRPSNVPVLGSEREDRGRKRKAGDVDVSIDVDALERDDRMTKEQVSRQYDTQRTQQGAGGWQGSADHEDLSGMVAEESAKRQKRDRDRRSKR